MSGDIVNTPRMGRSGKQDLFPLYLALAIAALLGGTAALVIAGRPLLAVVTAIASALLAVPLAGWIVAWHYLEADIVVTIRANGGLMETAQLATRDPDDRLIARLAHNGVISVRDGVVVLHDERIGRVLAFFIRLRLAK